MPTIDVTVQVVDSVDTIALNYDNQVTALTVTEIIPQIQVIQVDANADLIESVNDMIGVVRLTYKESLSYVGQVNGIYTYTVQHNLDYDAPMVMVYNDENDIVITEIEVVDNNSIRLISTSNMSGFKVVVQR